LSIINNGCLKKKLIHILLARYWVAEEGFDSLKMILEQEILSLQTTLKDQKYKSGGDATDRLLSRIADRNDIIRINTLRWVLEVIEKLENQKY
jgi:hypothetical protein